MRCSICRRTIGHDTRCPYYTPPKANHYCSICDNGIYDGEEYIENLDSKYAHYDCLTDLSYREIIKWLGGEIITMEDKFETNK